MGLDERGGVELFCSVTINFSVTIVREIQHNHITHSSWPTKMVTLLICVNYSTIHGLIISTLFHHVHIQLILSRHQPSLFIGRLANTE